VLAKNSLRRRS